MKFKKLIATLYVGIMMFSVSGFDNAVDLRINVKKGDKYNVHIVQEQESLITVNNQENKTNDVAEMNFTMDVKEDDNDKNSTIEYKYDSIQISREAYGNKIEYNSKNKTENNFLNSMYEGFIGKGFTVKLDSRGQVLDIKGIDELLTSVADNSANGDEQRKFIKEDLKKMFGEESIKSMIKKSTSYYPDKNIQNGDKWKNKYNIKTTFPIDVENTFKLLGEEDGVLMVGVESSLVSDTQNNPIDIMGVKTNISLNGNGKGSIEIDKASGIPKKATIKQIIEGYVESISNESTGEKIKIPMKISEKLTYEVIKK